MLFQLIVLVLVSRPVDPEDTTDGLLKAGVIPVWKQIEAGE
jgi:hypothetical protein